MQILKDLNNAIDFRSLDPNQFLENLKKEIQKAKQKIEAILQSEASFETTIEGYESASEDVNLLATVFFNLHSAEASDTIHNLAPKMSEELSRYSTELTLDEGLFKKVKEVYDKRDSLNLQPEPLKLLEETYESFVRNGALLEPSQKEQLKEINHKLSQLSPHFSKNVLDSTNEFYMELKSENDLLGLPESLIESAKEEAQSRGLDNSWVITLQAPSYIPFLKYSQIRDLRHKIWKAASTRSFKDHFDNQENVLNTVKLRHHRAQLLGFKTHADFVLSKRMAETPEKVMEFLNELYEVAYPAALKELEELKQIALKDQIDPLQAWDVAYYSEKLKHQKFDFNEEELRPYFSLDKVIQGVFKHAELLYGITFKKSDQYPTYHKDVQVYEVYDSDKNQFVGLFYADFFPRPTKKAGAWMTNFHEQGLFKGQVIRPHVGIVCNFTKPTEKKPSLLTLMEVRTLFHEFGHALHSLLSDCTYTSLAGTNVYWDFVELPSQLMENWTLEEGGLNLFADHYETHKKIPKEFIDKIKASSQFMAGYNTIRQLFFAHLDMAWHSHEHPEQIHNVEDFENTATKKLQLLPKTESTNISCSFSHIFSGGYSAGYYSYKWAEVLDADAFEFFKESGIFNSQVATSFKNNILKRGATEHPMDLYKKFRGREPDTQALLRRDGLIK